MGLRGKPNIGGLCHPIGIERDFKHAELASVPILGIWNGHASNFTSRFNRANSFLGGLLIGEGSGDGAFDRLNIVFKVARMPNSLEKAFSIQARALSLNGTLGLEASKKEGIFARAAYGASAPGADAISNNEGTLDLKTIVVRALSAGLAQEMGQDAQVEKNRASVLALKPGIEFYAELTDYFPSAAR